MLAGDRTEIARLTRGIGVLRTVDPEIPAQQVMAFLYVALHEGCKMQEIADFLGIAQSSTSRNVAALGKWHRTGKEGHNLLKTEPDRYDQRLKVIYLTSKGKRLMQAIIDAMGS